MTVPAFLDNEFTAYVKNNLN